MKKFIVYRKEMYQQAVHVEAKNAKEAIAKVEEGEGEVRPEGLDYSYTLETDTWHTERE